MITFGGNFYKRVRRLVQKLTNKKLSKPDLVQRLFGMLCLTEEGKYFEEFELDKDGDDNASLLVVSNTM